MAFDYNLFANQIKTLLVADAASIASSLSVNYPTITTDSIGIGEPTQIARSVDRYPFIVIQLDQKTNEFESLGLGANGKASKMVTSNVNLYGFIHVASDSQDSDKQCFTFARNIENVIDKNPYYEGSTTSQSWDKALVTNVTFGEDAYKEPSSDETYVSPCKIEVEFTKYDFR